MYVPTALIIGYGNPDRQDDGVAWHILTRLAEDLGRPIPSMDEGFYPNGENPDLYFGLQLIPELAETISAYQRVCFVDAHTGNVPEDVNVVAVTPEYQRSPFTHHMTADTCLSLVQTIYGQTPQAILVSVRGYEFGFSHELSPATLQLAEQAVKQIKVWLAS
jgi:hydrogenase maturation protease